MKAFTILGKEISTNIRVLKSGRGYVLPVGLRAEIPVGDRDADSTVQIENGRAHVHYCGVLQLASGKYIITAPLPHGGRDLTPEEQRTHYLHFDLSALVLWETGDKGVIVVDRYFTEVISQDSGSLLILFHPGANITLKVKGDTAKLCWTGRYFFWD